MTPQEIIDWRREIRKRFDRMELAEMYVKLMDKAENMEQVRRVVKEYYKEYKRSYDDCYKSYCDLVRYENGESQEVEPRRK